MSIMDRIVPVYSPDLAAAILAPIIWRDFLKELERNGALLMPPPKGKQ